MDDLRPVRRRRSALVAALAVVNAMAWTWIVWTVARIADVAVTTQAYLAVGFVTAGVVPVALVAGRQLATAGHPLGDGRPSDEQPV